MRITTHAHHLPPPPRPHPHLPPPPSGSQFAPTPRFSLARPKPVAATQQKRQDAASPPRSSLAHALRPPRVREDVEDAPSSDLGLEGRNDDNDDEEMLLTAEPGEVVQPSIENHHSYERQQVNDNPHAQTTDISPSSPKRRRLAAPGDPDPDLLLSPGHKSRTSKPASTNSTTTISHPRFAPFSHLVAPDSTSTISTSTATLPTLPRPSFLRPPTPPAAPPLPQSFSPHRRRGAASFVPGGVASTVQAWVVEAGVQRGGAALGRRGGGPNYPSLAQFQPQYLPNQQAQSGTWGFKVRVETAEEVLGGSGGWRVWGERDDGVGSETGSGEKIR